MAGTKHNGICYIEPYYGGSHKTLIDVLEGRYGGLKVTMRPKKWHWRTRAAALRISQTLPDAKDFDVLLVSSMLNLAELLALRPDWARVRRKVVYFHENQFEYPKQYDDKEERDYYFLHASVCSCLVADVIAWNSHFNRDSFLAGLSKLNAMLPTESDTKPDLELIRHSVLEKSIVIPMPVSIPKHIIRLDQVPLSQKRPLRIGFPHRWEHDKNPSEFLRVLARLVVEAKAEFTVHVFGGEMYEGSTAYNELLAALGGEASRIGGCGMIESREEYLKQLASCDVVISTAIHEFFGVAMCEAALLGCKVLCPKRLSYPELFCEDALYVSEAKLYKALKRMCERPDLIQARKPYNELLPGIRESLDMNSTGGQLFDVLLRRSEEHSSQMIEHSVTGARKRMLSLALGFLVGVTVLLF